MLDSLCRYLNGPSSLLGYAWESSPSAKLGARHGVQSCLKLAAVQPMENVAWNPSSRSRNSLMRRAGASKDAAPGFSVPSQALESLSA